MKDHLLAKPNHQIEKRRRELAKQKKKEEKRQRKLEKTTEEPGLDAPETGEAPADGAAEPAEET